MTHAQSRERARQIVALARLGKTCAEIQAVFPLSRKHIHHICREGDVQPTPAGRPIQQYATGSLHPFRVLARLKEGASDAAIGREYHVTRERIRQIKNLAIELGLLET